MENEKKICFIMCSNDERLAEECILYLKQLAIPEGYETQILVIKNADSMAAGYNRAMKQTDAKYKVYLHQDVLIVYRDFLKEMLKLFGKYPKLGMIGVVGNTSLAEDGCPWSDGIWRRIGDLYTDNVDQGTRNLFAEIDGDYENVMVLDGLLLATQYDLPWRENLFGGWDFYDCSQSLEFQRAGYEVGVPRMEEPWCLHDNDVLNLENYEQWRNVFAEEYHKDYMEGKNGKRAVYQFFSGKEHRPSFPYPPIVTEEGTEYLCFTEKKEASSKFWKMLYRETWTREEIRKYMSPYCRCMEVLEDEVIAGKLLEASGEAIEAKIRIPSFTQIPDVAFDETKAPPVRKNGAYAYRRNPVLTGGPYEGRPLLLTIGVPVSNQIDTIERCLSHIRKLLELPYTELIAVDTGSTDGTIEVCREYGARVVSFPWCGDMSAARNEAIFHAKGLWYLSIDDDEWFEDVDQIVGFFASGFYKKCNRATYIQRNYHFNSGETWTDNHTLRIAKITPTLHFEGRIHDALCGIEPKGKVCSLESVAHHYGFTHDDPQKGHQKYLRNAESLLYDMCEFPENLRYNYQLTNELVIDGHFAQAKAFALRGVSMQKELPGGYYGKVHAVSFVDAFYNEISGRLPAAVELVQDLYPYTEAERAYFAYAQMDVGLRRGAPYEKLLAACLDYEKWLAAFQKSPDRSYDLTMTGLHVCDNERYKNDARIMKFCIYIGLHRDEEALKAFEACDVEMVYDQNDSFVNHVVRADEKVFETVLGALSVTLREQWSGELLEACWKFCMIDNGGETERAARRLGFLLCHLSIRSLEAHLRARGGQMAGEMPEDFMEWLLQAKEETLSMQELYFYAGLLGQKITKEEKDLPVFLVYVQFLGAFAERYYHPTLFSGGGEEIAPEILACHELYCGLLHKQDLREMIGHMRRALELFPGFKSEIQLLLDQFTVSKQKELSPEDEMKVLAETLKNQAQSLLCSGKAEEAASILRELSEYVPDDHEVQALLLQADKDKFMRIGE